MYKPYMCIYIYIFSICFLLEMSWKMFPAKPVFFLTKTCGENQMGAPMVHKFLQVVLLMEEIRLTSWGW